MAFWRSSKSAHAYKKGSSIVSPIPRQLHFVWGFFGDDFDLPEQQQQTVKTWKKLNPRWRVEVHLPTSLKKLLHMQGRDTIDRLNHKKQQCDVFRPILMSEFGGIYSDLDVDPIHSIDDLFSRYSDAQVVLVEEETLSKRRAIEIGKEQPIRDGRPEHRLRIANFWMASAPYHPFWDDVWASIQERSRLPIRRDYDVTYTTGSDVITEVYHQTKRKYRDVVVVPKRIIDKYIVHHARGSWREGAGNSDAA